MPRFSVSRQKTQRFEICKWKSRLRLSSRVTAAFAGLDKISGCDFQAPALKCGGFAFGLALSRESPASNHAVGIPGLQTRATLYSGREEGQAGGGALSIVIHAQGNVTEVKRTSDPVVSQFDVEAALRRHLAR